ncbi:MAG TPA: TonB-dependent receptor [Sphingobium sp.]
MGIAAQPALAQSSNAPGLNSDAEIIVTARRKDERLQDVPTSIRAVSAETLEKLNIRDFKDIQSVVPGLQLTTSANGYSTGATVRGIKFDVESGGTNPSVEFYLNDAPITSNILFGALYDVGQVEVLRGPQGTLRGRAAPSGSITVTTRKPDLQDYGAYVLGTVNDLSGYNVNGAVNLPILKDILAIRVAGYHDKGELDRVYSIANSANPYSRTDSYRVSARFEPTDFLSVNASYQKIDRRLRSFDQVASLSGFNSAIPATNPVIRPEDRLGVTNGYKAVSQKSDQFNWSADLRFSGQKLSYVGSHSVQHNRAISPQDAANVLTSNTPRTLADAARAEPVCVQNTALFGYPGSAGEIEQCLHNRATQDSHELRLASEERVFGMFSYVVGGFINHYFTPSNITSEQAVLLPTFLGGGVASYVPTPIIRSASSTEKSLFGNVTAYLGEKTELSGGLRYIHYHAVDGLSVNGAVKPGNDDTFNTTIFAASLKHNFTDDIMTYASVGSSWRPGQRAVGNFSANQSALERSFINLAPEKSTSYEVGVKTSFWNRRVHFNVSAFHQDFTNFGLRGPLVSYINYTDATTTQVATFNFIAALPVKVDGVEVEASFDVTRNWNIGANFSYANGRIKNGRTACTDLNGDGIPDANPGTVQVSQLPANDHVSACNYNGPSTSAPKWNATIQSEYSHGLTDNVNGYLRGLLNIYPDYSQDISNPIDDVKAYSLFNLYAGIRTADGAIDISFFAKNLFNTYRALSVNNSLQSIGIQRLQPPTFRTTAPETLSANYVAVSSTAPREFGISMRYAFGSR